MARYTEDPNPQPDDEAASRTIRELLEVIFLDVRAIVCMFDRDLRVVRCNSAARAIVESLGADPDNFSLTDFHCEHIRADRKRLIDRAFTTMEPVRVNGMVSGCLLECVYRPIAIDPKTTNLLVISTPVVETHQAVANGDVHFHPAGANDMGHLSRLTERELVVLHLIGLGFTTDQIARRLHRSVKTVQGHRLSLGAKLNAENRVQLASIAIRTGLTTITSERELSELWKRSRNGA